MEKRAYVKSRIKIKSLVPALPLLIHFSAAEAAVPAQYIAKMYTETLGRAPDPAAWNGALGYFEPNECNRETLADWGAPFFSYPEFQGLSAAQPHLMRLITTGACQ